LSLGNIVAEPMINSDTPILSMVTVVIIIIIIIVVFKLLDYVSVKNKRMEKIINSEVIELVKDGQMDKEGMIKARIGIKEYQSFMRLAAGIRDINEIEISNLEINGQISFIKKERHG
jgi:uncharacterized membrane protein YcaP (DUF421 family)